MTHNNHSIRCLLAASAVAIAAAACTTSGPSHRRPPGDASVDGAVDGTTDGPTDRPPLCTANQPLRCEAGSLVRCNGNGTAELTEPCQLGCVAADLRCVELVPSNGLAKYLDMASSQPDFSLGDFTTFNTDTGEVLNSGDPVTVHSDIIAQTGNPGIPMIRVFAVRSLSTKSLTVRGRSAFAVVASGEIKIGGMLWIAGIGTSGAGAFNDAGCRGQDSIGDGGGAGGGGFGSKGGAGAGGVAQSGGSHFTLGAAGGNPSGEPSLVPLRGGCDGGNTNGNGGGAIQLVSRSSISILAEGKIVANGGGGYFGGGAGGGILLEAPTVVISGYLLANGGGGGNTMTCDSGQYGRFDGAPALGSPFCKTPGPSPLTFGPGGRGGAGSEPATDAEGSIWNYGGSGGGGYGRIRINTTSGDFTGAGIVSPNASRGTIVTR